MAEKMKCAICGRQSYTCAECKIRAGGMRIVSIIEDDLLHEENIKLKLVETKTIGPGIILHYRLIK